MQLGTGEWGFRFGGLLHWGFTDRDTEVDGPYVFSCLMISLVLGLCVITVGVSSLVSDGPWYVFVICRGPKQQFLTREPSTFRSLALCDQLNCAFCDCFLERRKFHTLCMSTWDEGLPGCWKVMLYRISQGEACWAQWELTIGLREGLLASSWSLGRYLAWSLGFWPVAV